MLTLHEPRRLGAARPAAAAGWLTVLAAALCARHCPQLAGPPVDGRAPGGSARCPLRPTCEVRLPWGRMFVFIGCQVCFYI